MAQSKTVKAATGKSKVVKTGKMAAVRGGKGKMFGKQSVKAAKSL